MKSEVRLSSRDRARTWWALIGLLLVVVYAPLFGAGPLGEDFQTLAESSRAVHPELGGEEDSGADLFYSRAGTSGRPLAALSLGTTGYLWTQAGVWTPFALTCLRLENLVLLLVGAIVLARFVRRLVVPWTGADQAMAAGYAAALLLCTHPLSVSAVASPAARGDLLGGLLALAAGTVFLRGRQERSYSFVALAALLTFACSLASELGYLVPVWLSLIEYYSSRRYRSGRVRLRTALTTLLVFTGFAGLDVVLRFVQGVPAWPQDLTRSTLMFLDFGDMWIAAFHSLEKVGVLMVPVNGGGEGGLGYVIAVLVLVAVLQPALHAGRSAPRFWATVLFAWLAVILMTASMRAFTSIAPGEFTHARGLFPAVIVMAIGLGLAATAIAGKRRFGIPLVVGLMLSVLARSNAESLRVAAAEGQIFQEQVGDVIVEGGADQHYLVVDVPETMRGYRVLPRDLGWMFDYATGFELAQVEMRDETHDELWVRPIATPALLAFTREPEFDALRESGLVIVLRRAGEDVDEAAERDGRDEAANEPAEEVLGRWRGQALELAGAAPTVVAWSNVEPDPADEQSVFGRGHWRGVSGDVPGLADSAAIEQITVEVPQREGVELEEEPSIFWRARGGLARGGDLRGVWLRVEGGRRAIFDPGGSLEWLLGPRVDSLMLLGSLADASGAELWPAAPEVEGAASFTILDEGWCFSPTEDDSSLFAGAESEWVVTLLDLADLRYLEVPCELDESLAAGVGSVASDGCLLEAADIEELVTRFWSGRKRLAWALERRVNGVVISRSRGRL